MRVHACRHCGEVFPSYPDLRQHLDSHVQPPIGHICTTCGRAFTRRDHLQRHSSRCRPKPFVCTVCDSSFTRERNLDRHKRTVQCGSPPQPGPAPKRRRSVASLNEDPCSRHRLNPLTITSRAPYKTLCRKTGPACGHTWFEAPSRHAITTDSRPRTCDY